MWILSIKKEKECLLNFINGHSLGFILEIKEWQSSDGNEHEP